MPTYRKEIKGRKFIQRYGRLEEKYLMNATISHLHTRQTRQINVYYPKGPTLVGVVFQQVSKRLKFVALL